MSLADKVRSAREKWVDAGGFKFQVRRPTEFQLSKLYQEDKTLKAEKLMLFVVDWKVQEKDIHSGGGGAIPAFEQEAFIEWVEDRSDVFTALYTAIVKLITDHQKQKGEAEKNS